MAFKRILNKL